MSQEKPRRGRDEQFRQQEPVKYGDVFNVSGEVASSAIAPGDAAKLQSAENQVLGATQKGGPAAVMQSAASENVRAGLVGRDDISDVAKDKGASVSEIKVGPNRVITETVGREVLGQFVEPNVPMNAPARALDRDAITVGEALEASAVSVAGDKPVDQSDAAAIQAAGVRATGSDEIKAGGIGAKAQSAATHNARTIPFEQKITISDVLSDAKEKLGGDKAVTREDAEAVIGAEIRNKPDMTTTPGGVAASVAAAASLNQN
ncbi:hypothetical protein L6164_010078 [Bauhinia variegata]|uniref:Uncharacterized protein n=1 Tax=Bauhinia variegata TaxID=167791 RepID=A0ACB9PL40_BAUVA|nr:hypothetical protein L6164_010078 [Bauhinia variegata]